MSSTKKHTFLLVLVLAGFLLSLASCQKNSPSEPESSPFSLTDTMLKRCPTTEVRLEQVRNELRLFGKIAAENSKTAQVYPVVGGNVVKINAELGDFVRQGEILAVVRSSEVADFQRQRLDAQAELAIAEKNLQVAKDLYEGKIASEKDLTSARTEVEKAQAELSRIKEVYNIYNLSRGSLYNISAPITGFIVHKDINQNELLRSDKSDAVFSIAEINKVWVMANVNESDIGKVALGYDAEVQTISYPDETFTGKVSKILNAIDPETKAMKIIVELDNAGFKLKPEMNATVKLRYREDRELCIIPASALIFDQSKNWVMVYHDRNHIETRQVEVYRQIGDQVYLSSGLKPGEKVIRENGLLVYDALND